MDSREQLLAGGRSGEPAIVPGDSAESHLVRLVSGVVEDVEMPPLSRRKRFPGLTGAEIGLLRAWIEKGAAW